ncbi:hypothetical protein K402DRAFT_410942 [Aulographum hederae CBS 113979]|uniref:Queuosine 5'-phosphate N-glycosylase/hydrolase n=1 Tax=Aulographum hederae CBS 113979 TaxID=1176131 RepID=A0A6G1H8B7_9PEZI|nr:hypothetical protein K402DRAFT_410942 [Aulographum hederae CBS 113979]
MSDDEADPELLELLRKSLGIGTADPNAPPETKVLDGAKYIYDNSIDVALDMYGTRAAADIIWKQMQERSYSTKTWSEYELHPKSKDEETLNFIFTMDLLNFSFWSMRGPDDRYAVEYKGKKWTGYWSMLAALHRALDEGIQITSPHYWHNDQDCTEESLRHVFRSATSEEMPLLSARYDCLKEAGLVLCQKFDSSISVLISKANNSAAGLVNLLAENFASFNDEAKFDRKKVRLLKRAQIFVADVWAAFEEESYGDFDDIEKITMFADYRIPQMLHTLGCISYSPPLDQAIRNQELIESGHSWELQLRGCSIWCVELIRRQIVQKHPETKVNAILIDFFLYDTMKELERDGKEQIPHHRTRSIWY